MKKAGKKNKRKDNSNNSNNSGPSEDIPQNEFSIFNKGGGNSIFKDEEIKSSKKKDEKEEEDSGDIFEKALLLMDEYAKMGLMFTDDYEPKSIIYPTSKIPLFTPSTRLNSALQVDDKNDCYFYYYTQKKSLYPTIYNQLIGISGTKSIFVQSELDALKETLPVNNNIIKEDNRNMTTTGLAQMFPIARTKSSIKEGIYFGNLSKVPEIFSKNRLPLF